MQFPAKVKVHAVKESSGTFEGKPFSSTTFHCTVDLKENSSGRSIGNVTRPFKLGDHKEFDKWANFGPKLPMDADAIFEMTAGADNQTALKLVSIAPSKGV